MSRIITEKEATEGKKAGTLRYVEQYVLGLEDRPVVTLDGSFVPMRYVEDRITNIGYAYAEVGW